MRQPAVAPDSVRDVTRTPTALIAVGALAALLALGCASREKRGALTLAGTIEARTVEVGSLVGGRVARVAVDEGSEVAAGDLLVAFETDLVDRDLDGAKARAAAAEARVAAAEAKLALARSGPRREAVERARIEWEASKTDLRRLEALNKDGVVGRADYDKAVVREATSRQSFEEANRGTRKEEIDGARATLEAERSALESERAAVARLERQREELFVSAPAAGRIESIDLRPGDLVAPNRAVARLLEPSELWVRVYVPEPRLGEVAVGEAAAVKVDSWPERTFTGKVVEIRHQAEYLPRNVQTLDQRSDQVFGVKVLLDAAGDLRPGMAATVTLTRTVPESGRSSGGGAAGAA